MEKFITWVERIAGVFLLAIALTTFVAVLMRKFLNIALPDAFDLSRLLLGITIFWGVASTCYRNGHILVDVVWDACGQRGRRWIDLGATALLLAFMVPFAWMFSSAVFETRAANILTYELRMPIWPWHLLAATGIVAATIMTLLRLVFVWRDDPGKVEADQHDQIRSAGAE